LGAGNIIAGGQNNGVGNSTGNGILGGTWNSIASGGGFSVINGGTSNRIDLNTSYSIIGGGFSNAITGNTATANTIAGGQYNIIGNQLINPTGSFIGGGQSNTTFASFAVAFGRNTRVTNDNVLAWSDGTADLSTTNSQARLTGTNGLFVNGPLWLGAANTNNGVYFLSNAPFAIWPITNSMPNFAHWWGNSNGTLVDMYYSNGVVFFKNLAP